MNDFFGVLFIILALIGGCILFVFFVSLWGMVSRENNSKDLESDFRAKRMQRNNELIYIIEELRTLPQMSDGTDSPERKAMWDFYNRKNNEDKSLTKRETEIIINAQYD